MKLYSGNNVDYLYKIALKECLERGSYVVSRVGKVYDLGPACFEIDSNEINTPFLKGRGLNPFFLIAEAAWFLDGRNELDILKFYLNSYNEYSDDGVTLNGAYGYRIQYESNFNQLHSVVEELEMFPHSRRAVISLYLPKDLKDTNKKDVPCNISILFKLRNGRLDLTVFNRSNDLFMGVPYNLFVFQVLHLYVSDQLNVPMGVQRHISDSLHLYEKNRSAVEVILKEDIDENVERLKKKSGLSILKLIIDESKFINSRQFDNMKKSIVKRAFIGYLSYKSGNVEDLLLLSRDDDIIGWALSDWLKVHCSKKISLI